MNKAAFGSDPGGSILANAKSAFCGSSASFMIGYASALDIFNNSGDLIPFPPGFGDTAANHAGSVAIALKTYWNQPTLPGPP